MDSRKLAIALVLLLTGCRIDSSLRDACGHYEGLISSMTVLNPITADVKFVSDLVAELRISVARNPAPLIFQVKKKSDTELELSSSAPADYLPDPLTLTQGKNSFCYTSAQTLASMLCIEQGQLQILLTSVRGQGLVSICLSKNGGCKAPPPDGPIPPNVVPPKEPPAAYAIEQLMDRARTRNFANLAEFEQALQAKLTAKNAELNLLIHLNATSLLALSSGTPQAIIQAIGNLGPFFLPNRWDQAAALRDQGQAALDAFEIMQATTMNEVQGLSLMILRDGAVVDRLGDSRVSIMAIRDELITAEHSPGSLYQVGISDELDVLLDSISRTLNTLAEAIYEERLILSQLAGFINPLAVAAVTPINVPPLAGPIPGPPEKWEQAAVASSLQLIQYDHLIRAAVHNADARYYQWLDPDAPDAAGVGLGYPSYVAVGASQVRQLQDMKLDATTRLLATVDQALGQSLLTFENYRVSVEQGQADDRIVARQLLNFRTGNVGESTSFGLNDLAAALQDKALMDVYQVDGLYGQLVLQAELDFLTYAGPYAQFTDAPVPDPAVPLPHP